MTFADLKPIGRAPLRLRIREALVDRILRGELIPGAKLPEAQLAAALGVSRTPLREALLGLEEEGLVVSNPARGFEVCAFTRAEVRELYPVLGTLECLALELTSDLSDVDVSRLSRVNADLSAATDPGNAKSLDVQWHTTLLSQSGNSRLAAMIGRTKSLVNRYELAYMRASGLIETSVRQHTAITHAIAIGDRDSAVSLLRSHWEQGMELVIAWLDSLPEVVDLQRQTSVAN